MMGLVSYYNHERTRGRNHGELQANSSEKLGGEQGQRETWAIRGNSPPKYFS